MRTRTGLCYTADASAKPSSKRRKITIEDDGLCCNLDYLERLPEDVVLVILSKLSATATCPADLQNVRITCKRLNSLAMNPMVLSKASPASLAIRARNWSESGHRFLEQCASAGNMEACYNLGMIRFYCFRERAAGAKLMARAAMASHAAAIYALAIIQFNGSGGTKNNKDLHAGVLLCARAAFLGHIDALRELGHCMQDGYGVRQNAAQGRRLLIEANARELAAGSSCTLIASAPWQQQHHHHHRLPSSSGPAAGSCCPLLSDFGCSLPAPKPHPANQFLVEWFNKTWYENTTTSSCGIGGGSGGGGGDGLRLCSHVGCGRPETRRHEFRRCSVCGVVNYCSRACQALDWKFRHKAECIPMEQLLQQLENDDAAAAQQDLVGDNVDGSGGETDAVVA